MEELCTEAGGYSRFFWTLVLHYFGWWVAVVAAPAIFLDHHRCEAKMPYLAWMLYGATLFAMLVMAVLLELSVVQRLGLLRAGEMGTLVTDKRWQLPLLTTVLWKLDSYTDVVFIFIARDCGSSLWWASLATFVFGVVFGQLLFNTCFACTDCDRELPSSFGFVLLDFKLVNTAVRHVLPFDPDASDLPIGRPVTLRTASTLVGFEKVVFDIAQVSIQSCFLYGAKAPNVFITFSIVCGVSHGAISLVTTLRGCFDEVWAGQAQGVMMGTVLMPAPGAIQMAADSSPSSPTSLEPEPDAHSNTGRSSTRESSRAGGRQTASREPRPAPAATELGRARMVDSPTGANGPDRSSDMLDLL
jgi:hypothetical protein